MSKALIEFKGKFITLYDLLTTFIDYPLPPLRTKGLKKGILSTFIDAIQQNHGVKLLRLMNYDQLKSMTDIKKEFFPAFFAIIRSITKQSNIVKDLNNTMDMQFNNQYKKESSDSKKSSSTPMRHRSNITEYTTPSNESDNENEYSTTYTTEFFYQHIASLQNDVDNKSSNEVSDNLTNLTIPKEKTILPCFTMLHTGQGIKGADCKYSHIKAELIKAWQDMFTELKTSPFNPNKHLTPGNIKNTYNTSASHLLIYNFQNSYHLVYGQKLAQSTRLYMIMQKRNSRDYNLTSMFLLILQLLLAWLLLQRQLLRLSDSVEIMLR